MDLRDRNGRPSALSPSFSQSLPIAVKCIETQYQDDGTQFQRQVSAFHVTTRTRDELAI
jgi:hypothetical protein